MGRQLEQNWHCQSWGNHKTIVFNEFKLLRPPYSLFNDDGQHLESSWWNLIVRVREVLKGTVVGIDWRFENLSGCSPQGQVNCTLWSGADGSWCYWLWRLGTCHSGNNNRQKWGQGTFHNEWLHGLAITLVAVWGLASQDLAGSILKVTLTATTYSMSREHSTKNRYHLLVGTYFWNKEPGEKPLHQVWISAWLPCVTTAQESGTHPSIILIHRWVVI